MKRDRTSNASRPSVKETAPVTGPTPPARRRHSRLDRHRRQRQCGHLLRTEHPRNLPAMGPRTLRRSESGRVRMQRNLRPALHRPSPHHLLDRHHFGPDIVCPGDVVVYSVPKWMDVVYDWTVTGGTVASTDGNQVSVIWGPAGVGTVTSRTRVRSFSASRSTMPRTASGEGHLTVEVLPELSFTSAPTTACTGQSLTFATNATVSIDWQRERARHRLDLRSILHCHLPFCWGLHCDRLRMVPTTATQTSP